ncbi:helix-turn-helix transcriptional regulator [Nakamurella lactea]|uniref:helix-turn-helix transcriptional regulator n=1 Tax=Nakamurella lactea TaxID=459515 RepID=UPI000405F5E4|nr:LuxR family transcriptional regulator [Nakamurella lactea]
MDDLETLGLTPAEVVAYRRLVDRPPMTVAEFADGLPGEPAVQELLAGLTAKGLATTWAGVPTRYAAVAPDVALDNLANAREEEIAKARIAAGELARRWSRVGRSVDPRELIEIVVGREATLQRAEQIQRTATDEVLIFDKPPYASSGLGNATELQLLTSGSTSFRCLYDRAALDLPGNYTRIQELVVAGESARVAPTVPLKMVMGDNRIALLPLETAPESIGVAAAIHPSALLDSLRALFEVLWQQAAPLRFTSTRPAGAGPASTVPESLSPMDQDVIQLLAAGLTDKAIGRQLGIGERTVQRRVKVMMQAYGVTNRLQLGMRLAGTGWG